MSVDEEVVRDLIEKLFDYHYTETTPSFKWFISRSTEISIPFLPISTSHSSHARHSSSAQALALFRLPGTFINVVPAGDLRLHVGIIKPFSTASAVESSRFDIVEEEGTEDWIANLQWDFEFISHVFYYVPIVGRTIYREKSWHASVFLRFEPRATTTQIEASDLGEGGSNLSRVDATPSDIKHSPSKTKRRMLLKKVVYSKIDRPQFLAWVPSSIAGLIVAVLKPFFSFFLSIVYGLLILFGLDHSSPSLSSTRVRRQKKYRKEANAQSRFVSTPKPKVRRTTSATPAPTPSSSPESATSGTSDSSLQSDASFDHTATESQYHYTMRKIHDLPLAFDRATLPFRQRIRRYKKWITQTIWEVLSFFVDVRDLIGELIMYVLTVGGSAVHIAILEGEGITNEERMQLMAEGRVDELDRGWFDTNGNRKRFREATIARNLGRAPGSYIHPDYDTELRGSSSRGSLKRTTGSDRHAGPRQSGSRVSFDLSSGESDDAREQPTPSRSYYPFPMSSNTTFVSATGPYIPTVTKPPAEYRPDPKFAPTDMDDTYEPPSPIQTPRRTTRKRPTYSPTTPTLAELLAEEEEDSQAEMMLMNSTPRKSPKYEVEEEEEEDDQPFARPIHAPTFHRSSSSSKSIGTPSPTLPLPPSSGSKVSHERIPTPIPTPLDSKTEFIAALSAKATSPSSTIATKGDQTPNVSPTRGGQVPMDLEDDWFDEIPEEEEEGRSEGRAEDRQEENAEGTLANFELGLESAEADFKRGGRNTYHSSSASSSNYSPTETRSPMTPFDSPEFRKINIREEAGAGQGVQSEGMKWERSARGKGKGREQERSVKHEEEDEEGYAIGRVDSHKARDYVGTTSKKTVDLKKEGGKKNA